MVDYIYQSPIIPVVIAGLVVVIVLLQCLSKRKFLKVRFSFACLITFAAAAFLVFFKDIEALGEEIYINLFYIGMIVTEILSLILLFSTIDFSMTNEKFQKTLTTSLDETKFFVFLDKKDRVRRISTCFLENLGIEEEDALKENFFDVVEAKYRIIGLNQESALKDDLKKFYYRYGERVTDGEKNQMELNIQAEDGSEGSFYFTENPIFSGGKYVGRILLGEMKDEESLMGMEKELSEAQGELELIRSRFTTLLYKTNDGIFFNNVTNNSIWFNDILVEKLALNGNSLNAQEFFSNMHPDDIAMYQSILSNVHGSDYEATFRYNTGSYYVYVKEVGQRISLNGVVEYCGIMNVVDNYNYEKTNTSLDSIGNEAEMLKQYKQMLNDENSVFMVAHFRVATVPEINERFGRPVGNMMLSEYVSFFKKTFVTNNLIYRVSGLEFVAFITNFNRMEALKNALKNDEKILHISANYANEKISTEVFMGLSYSNDTAARKDTVKNAKDALRICSNPQFKSAYAFYRDVK